MRTILLSILFFSIPFLSFAQLKLNKQLIRFSDKAASPYSIYKPQAFLSPKAIDRRFKNGIPITTQDLPINPHYLDSIRTTGAIIYSQSKWFNSCIIKVDSATLEQIKAFPFVESTEGVARHIEHKIKFKKENKQRDYLEDYPKTNSYYGFAALQIKQMNGQFIHQIGYKGDGIDIAVLDGGFTNVDIMPFFDSLRLYNKLHVGWDIVDNDNWLYESSAHGSNVLSTMAANLPGLMVGTAPEADYHLYKTEEVGGEYLIEEWNWIAGVEKADSAGIDVINSSLGYTEYYIEDMTYSKQDLNGKTSPATIAADIAAHKGIIVVNSAGNSGNSPWKKLGVPADAEHIVTVGSVNKSGKRSNFSSMGPTADGRIKPNLSAMGSYATVGSIYSYDTEYANGTSFSSPILAGMIASFWQAFPAHSNKEIIKAFELTANQSNQPDTLLGFGIPNVIKAFFKLNRKNILLSNKEAVLIKKQDNKIQLFVTHPEQWESIIIQNPITKSSKKIIPIFNQNAYLISLASDQLFWLKLTDFDGNSKMIR